MFESESDKKVRLNQHCGWIYFSVIPDGISPRGAGQKLLRHLLLAYGIPWETIRHDRFGRPYISDDPDFHLSLTHTDGLVAVAVSGGFIGLDAEPFNTTVPGGLLHFTQNEAYLKYLGCGLCNCPPRRKKISTRYLTKKYRGYLLSVCVPRFTRVQWVQAKGGL